MKWIHHFCLVRTELSNNMSVIALVTMWCGGIWARPQLVNEFVCRSQCRTGTVFNTCLRNWMNTSSVIQNDWSDDITFEHVIYFPALILSNKYQKAISCVSTNTEHCNNSCIWPCKLSKLDRYIKWKFDFWKRRLWQHWFQGNEVRV